MEIPVFEIKLSKKIMRQYKHEELLTDDDIHNMHLQFSNMFKRNIYGKFILCEIIDKAGIIMYNKIIIISPAERGQ